MNATVKNYEAIMHKLAIISDAIEEIEAGINLPSYEWNLAYDARKQAREIQSMLTEARQMELDKGGKPSGKVRQ